MDECQQAGDEAVEVRRLSVWKPSLQRQLQAWADPCLLLVPRALSPRAAEPPWEESLGQEKHGMPQPAEPLEALTQCWEGTPPQPAEPLGVVSPANTTCCII